jgi:ABC-type Mn2+/Zn2+ transport system permease subunit
MNWEMLLEPYLLRAVAVAAAVGVLCAWVGCFIYLRNLSLIGDALAHAVLPGILIAFLLVGYSLVGLVMGALAAGLLSTFLIAWIRQRLETRADAAIGIVFTAMFAIGVIGISVLSQTAGTHLDLKDFMFGNILGITPDDIFLVASTLACSILSILILFRYLFVTTLSPLQAKVMGIRAQAVHYFLMLLVSLTVVSALQAVGVILVVAMLIIPAATASLLTKRFWTLIWLATGVGLVATVLGVFLAAVLNWPPGPAMAVVGATIYGAAGITHLARKRTRPLPGLLPQN